MDLINDTPSSSFSVKFKIELGMLVILAVLTILLFIFKGAFINALEPVVRKLSFVIAASVAAILPGIVYKGGEWYLKFFRGDSLKTREKSFLIFILELGVAIILAIIAQRIIVNLFPQFIKYVWILLVEWFLLLYVWFIRVKRLGFPWFYVIATNVILAVFAYITYTYV